MSAPLKRYVLALIVVESAFYESTVIERPETTGHEILHDSDDHNAVLDEFRYYSELIDDVRGSGDPPEEG